MAFFNVVVNADCPTTVSKVMGRYLRAETIKFSIVEFIIRKAKIVLGLQIGWLEQPIFWFAKQIVVMIGVD